MKHQRLFEHSLIISPSCRKEYFLRYRNQYPEDDIVLMSVEELEDLFHYHHDLRAVRYLIKKGKGYKEAKDILKCLEYIDLKKAYQSKRLKEFQHLAGEMVAMGLLYKDEYALKLFKGRDIIIDGYPEGKRISYALDNVPNISMNWFKNGEENEDYPKVATFSNIYEELHYVCNLIADDIAHGTKPSDILISGYSEEFYLPFSLMSNAYGFTIAFPNEKTLLQTNLVRDFFATLDNLEDVDEAGLTLILNTLQEKYSTQEGFSSFVQIVFGLYCDFLSKEEKKHLYQEAFKEAKLPDVSYLDAVGILNEDFPVEGKHIYRIDFNLSNAPRVAADNDFLFDEEKKELGMRTSAKVNAQAKANLLAFLHSTCLRSVSYHGRHLTNSKNPSSLIADSKKGPNVDSPLITIDKPKLPFDYSLPFARVWLAHMQDNAFQFGVEAPELDAVKAQVGNVEKPYNNDFSPFPAIMNPEKITLSASSIDTYAKCPFHYYCSTVLGIDDSESTFSASIGTIFHYVLERFYSPDFDPKAVYEEAIAKQESKRGEPFSIREHVLLRNLYSRLEEDLDFLKEHDEMMRSPNNNGLYAPQYLREFRKTIHVSDNLYLTGSADKIILTSSSSGEYSTFVDYKTYSKSFDLDALQYGMCLQLPIYAFMASEIEEFKNRKTIGLFIAPILPSAISGSKDKIFAEVRRNDLKLNGVYSDDLDGLHTLDYDYKQSKIIAGCSYGKNGFRADNKRIISDKLMDKIIQMAREKIIEAGDGINAGNFEIHSLTYKNEDGCSFCPFHDVCYRRADQLEEIRAAEASLGGAIIEGGENNA